MIVISTKTHVNGMTGRDVTEFLSTCGDEEYQAWWPGTHLRFHTVRGSNGSAGSIVYMDEYVGKYRVRGHAVVREHLQGKRLLVQMIWLRIPLPVFVDIRLDDDKYGVTIRHEVRIGYKGVGRILDPLLGIGHGAAFARALDEHVREEFPRLKTLLHPATVNR